MEDSWYVHATCVPVNCVSALFVSWLMAENQRSTIFLTAPSYQMIADVGDSLVERTLPGGAFRNLHGVNAPRPSFPTLGTALRKPMARFLGILAEVRLRLLKHVSGHRGSFLVRPLAQVCSGIRGRAWSQVRLRSAGPFTLVTGKIQL